MAHDTVTVTCSTVAATESTGCHILKVSGYPQAKMALCTGKYLMSAKFEAAGHSWRLIIYPNGIREQCDPGCISLGLMLDSESKDVQVSLHFSFVRHDAKLTQKPQGGRITVKPVIFPSRRAYQGFRTAGKKELQDKKAYIKNDAILIRCDITVYNKPAVVKHGVQAMMELFCDCDDQHCINLHVAGKASGQLQSDDLIVPPGTKLTNGYLRLPSCGNEVVPPPPPPSASKISFTASRGCHIMKLSRYWLTMLLSGNGTPVESGEFKVAGHTWRIRCYPNGKESDRYISLLLELASEATKVHAGFCFSLLPKGKLTAEPHDDASATARTVFKGMHDSWGFTAFMTHEDLETNRYLKDDSVFIRCDITVMNKSPVRKPHDIEKLQLLCDCKDDLCKNVHREAATSSRRGCHMIKKMLLGCLPTSLD